MRRIKMLLVCLASVILFCFAGQFTVFGATELNVTSDKTLTSKFNKYDNVKISKDKTLTLATRSGDPVGLEITNSLVVEEGGKITGDGILIFHKNATFSGISLYYKYDGKIKKIPPNYRFDQMDIDEDYKPEFVFDSSQGIYVLKGERKGGDPFELSLSERYLTMVVKDKQQLDLSGLTKEVTWKSSNKSVATISKSGKVTAKKTGTTVITATYDGQEYTCEIEVVKKGLNIDETYLTVGEKFYLTLNGTNVKSVSSSNKKVAKINKKLEITAVSAGKCTLTVKGTDGKKYKCTVEVEKKKKK